MKEATLTLRCATEPFAHELGILAELFKGIPDIAAECSQEIISFFERPDEAFFICKTNDAVAPITGELFISFEPSKLLVGFVAAIRTRDVDALREFIHNNSPSGRVATTSLGEGGAGVTTRPADKVEEA